MKRILLPAGVTLVVIAAFLAVAGSNRASEPLVRLTVSEREARLIQRVAERADDDPGVQLQLAYTAREHPLDARNWLTDQRLRDIGFFFDVMPGAPEAEEAYGRALPKLAWVALEYNGNAWREIERQRALAPHSPENRHDDAREPSRLVPVDAAADAETLARRYPTGHLVVRASIELVYVPPSRKGPYIYGRIRHLIPATLHVPRAIRHPLAGLDATFGPPRYEVDLAVGSLGILYVTGLRRTQSAVQ